MTKNTNADQLARISTLARAIASGYSATAARYRQEAATVERLRQAPRNPLRGLQGFAAAAANVGRALSEHRKASFALMTVALGGDSAVNTTSPCGTTGGAETLEAAEASLDRTMEACMKWRANVRELKLLVLHLLPELDGELRYVDVDCIAWEDRPEADWELMVKELKTIDDKATRKLRPIPSGATKQKGKPGSKPRELDDDLATLREAAEYASDKEYERAANHGEGYVNKVRKRAEGKAGGKERLKELLSRKPRQ
ncbi:MAG: hypothetical protein U1A77_14065 [Pirellulales bacterium]